MISLIRAWHNLHKTIISIVHQIYLTLNLGEIICQHMLTFLSLNDIMQMVLPFNETSLIELLHSTFTFTTLSSVRRKRVVSHRP